MSFKRMKKGNERTRFIGHVPVCVRGKKKGDNSGRSSREEGRTHLKGEGKKSGEAFMSRTSFGVGKRRFVLRVQGRQGRGSCAERPDERPFFPSLIAVWRGC